MSETALPRKALFLHIQKTAGTSIIHLACRYYGASMTSHGDYVGKPPEAFQDVRFVSGHFGYEFARRLMHDRYAFVFLRDPKKRILSMYSFLRSQKEDLFPMYRLAKELDLPAFLKAGFTHPMVKGHLWNNQVWQLACGWANPGKKKVGDFRPRELLSLAKAHLDEFDHVGFTETFEQDRDIILRALGLPTPWKKVRVNVSPKPRIEISSEVEALLDGLTELDRRLYAYAWQKFKKEKEEHGNWWVRLKRALPIAK